MNEATEGIISIETVCGIEELWKIKLKEGWAKTASNRKSTILCVVSGLAYLMNRQLNEVEIRRPIKIHAF